MAQHSILNIGELPVEIGHAPRDITFNHKWNNVEQQRVTSKPTIQRTGSDLDTLGFTVRLRKEFLDLCQISDNPYQYYKKIKKIGDDAEVVVLSSGNAVVYGKFVLESIGGSVLDTADNGGWIDIELTLEFKEYVA